MRRIYLIAALLLAKPAASLELAYMALENNRANQLYAEELADHLSADAARTVPIIELENFVRNSGNHSEAFLIELPPELGALAIEAGWTQTHVSTTPVKIGLYRAAGSTGAIARVSSTPRNTLAFSSLEQLAPDAEYVSAGSHTQCLRRMFDGTADACASPVAFADRYAERFGLELELVGAPLLTEPVGLYANAGTSSDELARLRNTDFKLSRGAAFTGLQP